MNIDLKAQTQSLLNTNVGQDTIKSSNSGVGVATLPIFSQLLTSQVKVFQELDAKNTVNTAQLLSPNIVQASKLQAKDNPHQEEIRAAVSRQADAFVNIAKSGEVNSAQVSTPQASTLSQGRTEFAYAKLAEMQAQAKNMRVFSKESGPNTDSEVLQAQARSRLGSFQAVLKSTSFEVHEKDQLAPKKSVNPETEAITAMGISASENQGHGGEAGSSGESELANLPIQGNTMHGQVHALFGSLQWSEEISQRMILMVGANMHLAVLNLNPDNLGLLKIVITVKDHQVNATFVSNNADVRQALQDGLEQLRSSMSEVDLILEQADVRSGASYEESEASALASKAESGANSSLSNEHHSALSQLLNEQAPKASKAQSRALSMQYDGTVNVFV
ncbi:flagellar hook-length control protein FliK [Polynucleobacter sp. MG-5-Ahmo-C2]|jgi:flagellar hook-length control protein FliK|uniref:flagellar hook-length control protein FliK n=1 Tax=Polynucleobacter sp. MG-5-Ahmo-C2 TaxID=2081051 RepID=UPI001BFE8200|nr:flagellar hook-length control protein FliK [Polynucleobacter sp. MG-5-Ahmo-C2]QWD97882.1 flagellar hook-length control protein FliK [Polynucleobacter sp. MG-5-Ahmo-C2]